MVLKCCAKDTARQAQPCSLGTTGARRAAKAIFEATFPGWGPRVHTVTNVQKAEMSVARTRNRVFIAKGEAQQ